MLASIRNEYGVMGHVYADAAMMHHMGTKKQAG